ncbi:hypothetical protein J2X35_003859 [Mesorhizobium sp. BE184]|nr:hypothetical protein [Mesorhizobium sp. BE184]
MSLPGPRDARCGCGIGPALLVVGQRPDLFGDAEMTMTLPDRLTHHCGTVETRNES